MNLRSLVVAANIGVAFLMGAGGAAQAAEVRVLSGYAMRDIMIDVGPKFEHATGHKLAMRFANPRKIESMIQDPEIADVVIASTVDVANGHFLPGSVTPVARGLLGVAVRKGAPMPDISSADAVKRALLAAKSISYNRAGNSFTHLSGVFERWGIAGELKPKTTLGTPPPGRVGDLVASGEVEIGLHSISLLIGIPGIEIIGPLPEDLQPSGIVNFAAIMSGTADMAAAKALIEFLRTPEAAAVIKGKGMTPPVL
jgi:molybdate transport system substrate-binding protein